MRSRCAPIVLALAVIAGACSGSDEAAPSVASDTAEPEPTEVSSPATSGPATTEETAPPSSAAEVSPSVTVAVVPMPDHVTEVQLPWWSADGESIVLSARSTEFPGMQIVRVDPDGSDFTCLTCSIAAGEPPLMKPIAFDDGQRVLVRIGNQTPFTNGEHAVLECSPSVAQCDVAELVPIVVPVDDLVVQPQREFRVAPGGERVGFTQMRPNGRGDPVYVAVVAGLRREADRYELVDPRVISHRGELKQFSPDGTTAYVSSFVEGPEAGNGDVIAIDLASGDEQRITWYPDYDEPVEPSPDGRWFTVGSARTAKIFESIAQLRRPNVIGAAISPLALYLFNTYRDELLEPWLITADGEAAGELGLLLNPGSVADGWEGRMIPNWNPDGRRILFWEAASESTAGSADAGSRVVISTLDGIGQPGAAPTPQLPDLSWAPVLIGYAPPASAIPESRTGDASGTMEVEVTDTADLTITVTYTGFSDDGDWVIDGTETIVNSGGPTGSLTYTADLTLSGAHSGFLRAVDVTGTAAEGFTGTIESEVDGNAATLVLG
jgi:hypothetical protein